MQELNNFNILLYLLSFLKINKFMDLFEVV